MVRSVHRTPKVKTYATLVSVQVRSTFNKEHLAMHHKDWRDALYHQTQILQPGTETHEDTFSPTIYKSRHLIIPDYDRVTTIAWAKVRRIADHLEMSLFASI